METYSIVFLNNIGNNNFKGFEFPCDKEGNLKKQPTTTKRVDDKYRYCRSHRKRFSIIHIIENRTGGVYKPEWV